MKIIHKTDALHVDKPEGTSVDYYLRSEYEVHYNEQAPHTTQTWHHHNLISETLFILDGELTANWIEGEQKHSQIVSSGDLIETENSPHTFTNHTSHKVKFLVFKQVLTGRDKSDILKNDKVLDPQ